MNSLTFFSGAVHGIYLIISLVAGLELWFDIFRIREKPITILMRGIGTAMFLDACAILLNGLYVVFPEEKWLFYAMVRLDVCVLMTYYLSFTTIVTGRLPKPKWLAVICMPFLVCLALSFSGVITPIECQTTAYAFSPIYPFILGIIIYRRSWIRRRIYSEPDNKLGLWAIGLMVIMVLNPVIYITLVLLDAYNDLSNMLVLLFFALQGFLFAAFAYHHDMEVDNVMEEELENVSVQLPVEQGRNLQDKGKEKHELFMRLTQEEKIYRDPNIGLEMLAERMGMNRTYLYTYLRDVEKMSFTDYVNSYRIADAKQMLVNSDERIADIATRCGFNSLQSFYRVFKKYTGITPSELRNERSKDA